MLTHMLVSSDGMRGKIPHFKINKGTNADMEYILDMRSNLVHYVHLIDIYAPCIVGHSQWNDKANMMRYCGNSASLFNDFVFSISDEAFVLLVLLNYTETWMFELELEQSKVRKQLWKTNIQLSTINSQIIHVGWHTLAMTDASKRRWRRHSDECIRSGKKEPDCVVDV
jgi:hypothetical protein